MSDVKAEGSNPWWWKPLWVAVLVVTVALGVNVYFLFHPPLERVVGGVALTLLCMSIAYYIRVRPSTKVNKAIYRLLGISPIGFSLWVIYAVSGMGRWLTTHLGVWPFLITGLTVPYIVGVLIGEWIGRRRDYRLPSSP